MSTLTYMHEARSPRGFAPVMRSAAPHDRGAQELAAALLRDFGRPVPEAPDAGVLWTLLLAVPTLGLLPALVWPLRLHPFIAAEGRQYRGLAQWLSDYTRHVDYTDGFTRAAQAIRPRMLLSAVASASVLMAAMLLAVFAWLGPWRPIDFLLDCTYGFTPAQLAGGRAPSHASPQFRMAIYAMWIGALSIAFACQWLQVHMHARAVRRCLNHFNQIIIHEGLAPVFLSPIGFGLRPLWVIGAVPLLAWGAVWGAPLMLAGAVQRRYSRKASRVARVNIAGRVRDLLVLRRPEPPPPIASLARGVVTTRARCATQVCCQLLPSGSRFCPRCGARVLPPIDRLA